MARDSIARLLATVVHVTREEVSNTAQRHETYLRLIPAFEGEDIAAGRYCRGIDPAFDAAMEELHTEQAPR